MNIEFDDQNVCLNSYQGDEWFINKEIAELKNSIKIQDLAIK